MFCIYDDCSIEDILWDREKYWQSQLFANVKGILWDREKYWQSQ